LVKKVISRAARNAYRFEYSLLSRNCSTEVLASIDEAFPPKQKMTSVNLTLGTLPNPVIKPLFGALLERGLVTSESAITTWEDEVSDGGIGFAKKMIDYAPIGEERATLDKSIRVIPGSRPQVNSQ
jgi:hypothetical protein